MTHYEDWRQAYAATSKQQSEHIRPAVRGKDIPELLYDLLRRATPYGTEHHIVDLFPFKDKGRTDEFGNFIVKIGDKPTVMFSSHMDTVHTLSGKNEKKDYGVIVPLMMNDKAPDMEQGFIWAGLHRFAKAEEGKKPKFLGYSGTALGADDKVGVYTMCKMIEANIEGLYVFHVGEEVGCIGSGLIVKQTPDLVAGIQACIAFDRAGYTDVISHQRSNRCASDEFSDALAAALNEHINIPKQKFSGRARGVYTDSAEYVKLIPECTNVSVGYFSQHGDAERFDMYWYQKYFLPAVLKLEWNKLPIKRDPRELETHSYSYTKQWSSSSIAKVKVNEVDKNTPLVKIPDWKPEDGFLEDASLEGMTRIIYNWMFGLGRQEKAAGLIAQLLMENLELQEENDSLMDDLDEETRPEDYEGFDPAEPDTSLASDPNAGQQLLLAAPKEEVVESKEGKALAGDKMAMLTSFFQLKGQVPFSAKEKNKLGNAQARYDKLCRRCLRLRKISTEDYKLLNEMLYEVSGIFLMRKASGSSSIVDKLIADALRHMWEHQLEEGLENVREEAVQAG